VSTAPWWDDGTADLMALVAATRSDDRLALDVLARFADRDSCLASAVKLLAELAADAGFCQDCFREYAARAIAR
jgi:hypothetical protein